MKAPCHFAGSLMVASKTMLFWELEDCEGMPVKVLLFSFNRRRI
jgi:hypothetical protein